MANKIWVGASNGDWAASGNWSPAGVPTTGDNVTIPSTALFAITTGLNQSAVALGTVEVDGFTKAIGSAAGYLQIKCTRLTFKGSGQAYIDLGAEAITAYVDGTATGTDPVPGLFLKGSALVAVAVSGGNVGLAVQASETSTVATARCTGSTSKLLLGAGVTVTTIFANGGTLTAKCAFTTAHVNGGTFWHLGSTTGTTINTNSGNAYPCSTGTITNVNCNGGTTDATKVLSARTWSNVKRNPGSTFVYDPATLTITTHVAPDYPVHIKTLAA